MPDRCACATLPVQRQYGDRLMIDVDATTVRLLGHTRTGTMVLQRADCPLEQTGKILEAETRYTLRHYLRCRSCDRTVLYGLCIRGEPVFRDAEPDEPLTVPWERSDTFVDVLGGPVLRYGR
ncbi:hypothetical protein AB0G04_13300 [Actinoplanes sp. NPDC023801]|uniref:hypothetical protein n=1 Tax=Actinoplanes sp. NPDC023801 TaxID=3154595 RepID=UPI0033F5FFA9